MFKTYLRLALIFSVFRVVIAENLFESGIHNFYLGGGLGGGVNFFSPTNTTVSVTNPEHASFSWRLFAGYNINKIFALELGYTNFGYYENSALGNSVCDTNGACGYHTASPANGIFNTQLNVVNQIQSSAIDLTILGRYYLDSSSNLFAKAGISYLNLNLATQTTISPEIGVSNPIGPTINQSITSVNQNKLSPVVGVGYQYDANKTLSLRFEYSYYFGSELIDGSGINQGKLYPSTFLLSTVFNL